MGINGIHDFRCVGGGKDEEVVREVEEEVLDAELEVEEEVEEEEDVLVEV